MNSPARSHPQAFLSSVQIGRAFAATAVVLQHALRDADRYYPLFTEYSPGFALDPAGWAELLGAGVDLFFVISGVVMVVSTWHGHGSIGGFLYRRVTRIFPLYWVLTLAFMGVLVIAPGLFSQMQLEPAHAICSLMLVPCTGPSGEAIPYIYAGWTLTYELVFYGLFALSLLAGTRGWRVVLAIGLILAWHSLYYTPLRAIPAFEHSTSPLILEFIFGVLLGYAYFYIRFDRKWALPLMGVGCTLLVLSHTGSWVEWPRFLRWGIPASLIVAGLMCSNRTSSSQGLSYRGLVYLGAASYALYLFHFVTLKLFYVVAGKLGVLSLIRPMLGVLIALLVSVASAALLYELCEKPLTRLCKWAKQARQQRTRVMARPQTTSVYAYVPE